MLTLRALLATAFASATLGIAQGQIVTPSAFDFGIVDSDFDLTAFETAISQFDEITFGTTETNFDNFDPAFFASVQVTSSETVIAANRSILSIQVQTLPQTTPPDASPRFATDGASATTVTGNLPLDSITPIIGDANIGGKGITFTNDIETINSATIRYFVDGVAIYSDASSIIGSVLTDGNELSTDFFSFNLRTPFSGSDQGIDFADEFLLEFDVTVVPEPSSYALIACALTLCWAVARRRG